MSWSEDCLYALCAERIFEDSGHLTRFKELLECYSNYPFFSKGLCKCMYLSAWDEEHFHIMLETLMEMSLGRDRNTSEMRMKGDVLAEEQEKNMDGEYYVYLLSNSFLDGSEFHLDEDAVIPPEILYIIGQARRAAQIIDSV